MKTFFCWCIVLLFTLPITGWAQVPAFLYDLERPHEVHYLPEVLEEVSGLTHYSTNRIAALNDEHGRMYVYDLLLKKIVHKVRFEGNGDFEGIELVNNYVYAIKSNGDMYRFNVEMTGVVEKIDSPFKADNDIEGLGYDPNGHRLLVALKGESDIKGLDVKGKAVYAFDLKTDKFQRLPAITLEDKDIQRVLQSDKTKMRPSGIAVHPHSGEIYLLASTGRMLIVFHPDGKPKNISILKRKLFPQPEGIAFSPEGDLFISNEQEGQGGTLLHFKMKGLR